MKGWIAFGVLGSIVLIISLTIGIWAIRYYSAHARGAVQAREQIQSGASRIVNYDHFFNLCAAVQGNEVALEAMYQQLTTTDDVKEQQRIQANIAGLVGQRGRDIAQYNADARKSYTQGQFRDSSLPYQLPTKTYEKGVHTSCD